MDMKFIGKAGLVTGGGSGIGRTCALAFAREGARVVIADIAVAGGRETVQMVKRGGGEAIFVETDVSKREAVEAMIDKAVGAYGKIDFAFNNAGIGGPLGVPTADYDEEIWDRVIAINLKGVWLCMKSEIRQMVKQGGGTIVNTSSGAGLRGSRNVGTAYTASKHGVVGLTKNAALEYARSGIRVNAVCPSLILTPMGDEMFGDQNRKVQFADRIPVGRLGMPEDVAAAVLWLCSETTSYVTGIALSVDGGLMA